MLIHYRRKIVLWPLAIAALLTALFFSVATHAADTVTEGYDAASPINDGMLVSIDEDNNRVVAPTTQKTINNLIGVAVKNGAAPLSISTNSAQVQVATNGVVDIYVSDLNGAVETGDPITISNIAGIGAKAVSNVKIIGIAQTGVANPSKQDLGNGRTAMVGQVPVAIGIAYHYAEAKKTIIPGALQELANAVAGKNVSPAPIIISGVIFVITMIIVASLIYSMIRSAIISVGRNPLAQSAVYRDVIQLSILVLGIITGAIVAIYLILRNL